MNLFKILSRTLGFLTLILALLSSDIKAQNSHTPAKKVNFKVATAYPLSFSEVNTLTGYLGERYEKNLRNRLLSIDEVGILEGFQKRPGKQRWIGEHVGKYLEAASNTWMVTKDPALKAQMDRIFNELLKTQLPDGYLGTYLPEMYWTAWDVWVHKYDLVGLLAYYKATGNKDAYDASVKIGDLLLKIFGEKEGQKDIIKAGSHVGMAATSVIEPMTELYMWTGDKRYLDFCEYNVRAYDHTGGPAIVSTLLKEKQVNKVANGKAYEMLSNLVGIMKLYRLTGNMDYLTASQYAFNDIVSKRLFVTGTSSDHERFKPDFELEADTAAHMGEGCVTTTWIQFNMQLFAASGDLKYYDEIEKSIYNHLLGAENPVTGCVSYYTPLIGVKPYRCHITCCLSSVPRGIAWIPYLNYGKLNQKPAILIYEGALIKDNVQFDNGLQSEMKISINSDFPERGSAKIKMELTSSGHFSLQLRVPEWARNFKAIVDNKVYSGKPDSFVTISRDWKKENSITVSFDMPVEILPGGPTYTNRVAFKRGPQVMSLDQSLNPSFDIQTTSFRIPGVVQFNKAEDKLPAYWQDKQAYSVNLKKVGGNEMQPIVLVPFAEASQSAGFSNVWIGKAK